MLIYCKVLVPCRRDDLSQEMTVLQPRDQGEVPGVTSMGLRHTEGTGLVGKEVAGGVC